MKERPTSPHITIYKWQLSSSVASILHRISGVCAFFGIGILSLILCHVYHYGYGSLLTGSKGSFLLILFKLSLFGVGYAVCYHLLNGIKYLYFDLTANITKSTMSAGIIIVLFLTKVLMGLIVFLVMFK